MPAKPYYTYLDESQWSDKISSAYKLASRCVLCPRKCGVNRTAGETGFCGAGSVMRISSIFPHHGEEPPISGTNGSGTVFFSHCTLCCVFCQNFQISHDGEGEEYQPEKLALKMLHLQNLNCHNINLVTPSHFLPWILESVRQASALGLCIPIVYNCGGYETQETLALLDNIVDIYLPDMKYGNNTSAAQYSNAPDYTEVNQAAVKEMFGQVGPLKCDDNEIAYRGIIIRHLVLPDNKADSKSVRLFLSGNFDPQDMTMSIMAQYRPLHKAAEYGGMNRLITLEEYEPVRESFINDGFEGFFQETEKLNESFVIDFKTRKFDELTGE